jgi:NADH-quinone oxidoreductase subunit C
VATVPLPPPEVESRLRARFGDDVVAFAEQHGHAVVTVTRERYREVVRFLRDDPAFACDFCDFVAGVDHAEEGLEVITHLFSTVLGHNIRLKVPLPKDDPACPSIADLFAGANWHERETMEMFGIGFDGHPLPVKLLLSEPFDAHPLRKDFVLMTREAKPWPGAVEGEEEEEE